MFTAGTPLVVGQGWFGSTLAGRMGWRSVSRRNFRPGAVPPGACVVVASGRSSIGRAEGPAAIRTELDHLRRVLDSCDAARARRVVVLGSADVAGLAPEIRATTPQDPRTLYAEVKTVAEDECVGRAAAGQPVTCVRMGPIHGVGKHRTAVLVDVAGWPVVPLPGAAAHSTGFILVDDAVEAVAWLTANDAPAVVAVGAGHVPLRGLLSALAQAQGSRLRVVPVPGVQPLVRLASRRLPSDKAQWLIRLALPRAVHMELPVPLTPLDEAARILVHGVSTERGAGAQVGGSAVPDVEPAPALPEVVGA